MASEYDLKLDKFGIDMNRYRELKYFCRQYPGKKKELKKLRQMADSLGSPSADKAPRSSFVSDPTARRAEKMADLSHEIDIIEQAAYEADPYDWQELLRHVSEGVPVEHLELTQCWRKFYETRRRFYWLLSQRR